MTKLIVVMTSLIFLMIDTSALAKSNIETFSLGFDRKKEVIDVVNIRGNQENNSMSVKHQVKGNDIYIECVISNFSFSKRDDKTNSNKSGNGYIQLYLNGKKIDNIYAAAFIIKGLPAGKHQIKLELVHNDGTPYQIEKEFDVTI